MVARWPAENLETLFRLFSHLTHFGPLCYYSLKKTFQVAIAESLGVKQERVKILDLKKGR
jgi:hypothetical protein